MPQDMSQNLTAKAVHAAKWSYTATAISAVMQIGFASAEFLERGCAAVAARSAGGVSVA